MQKINR